MKTALRIGWIVFCLALALAARGWNLRDIFLDGKIYFVDPDCYSRMTRARLVLEDPGTLVRHHDFENWPQGVTPHTTAPLDYLIVGTKGILDAVFALFSGEASSVLRGQTLDLAGALLPPLLGLAGGLFLALALWKWGVRFWEAALLLYAISPILVHGTLLGRPDHQALLIFLLTGAIGAELALIGLTTQKEDGGTGRGWAIVSGVAWGLSLWVSFYEPLILLGAVLAFWLAWNRRALWSRMRLPGAITFAAILLLMLVIEGWPIALPDPAVRAYFPNWQRTIAELAHLDLRSPLLFAWLGWAVIASPVLLFLAGRQDRRAFFLLALLGATFALTLWQVRWGYFLALVFVWSLPWQMQAWRRGWLAWLILIAGLWPILQDWDRRLFPEGLAEEHLAMQRRELVALRESVEATIGRNGGPFIAPWWLSPAIAYWTQQPGVAGSSHESLPGIVDTARFYLSADPAEAAAILRARRVRWVFSDEPSREIGTSALLLGVTPPASPLATLLDERPDEVPGFLLEWKAPPTPGGQRFYRLYEVDDATFPR